MMKRLVILSAAAAFGLFSGCGSEGGGGGGGTTTATGGGATGATSTGTGDGATAGTTDGGGEGCASTLFADHMCNPLCPEANGCVDGQNCTFALVGEGFACSSAGTQSLWKGCNEETFCAEGGCIDVPDLGNKCAPFCEEDADCGDEYLCNLEVSVGELTIRMCAPKLPGCSVFDQDCEEEGKACYLAGDTSCLDAGEGGVAAPCDAPNACNPGLICVSDKCHTPCNPRTSGPDPKCHLMPGCQQGDIQGVDDVAICSLPDDEPPCNMLQDDCTDGQICYLTGDGPRCRDAGDAPASSPCDQSTDCAPGLACWPNKCVAVCDPNEALHDECNGAGTPCANLPGSGGAGFCDE